MKTPIILYEDDQILVVDKPPGLVVNNADTIKEETLETWLTQEKGATAQRGGIVHRLDKDTSGVLLVAKTDAVVLALQEQFASRTTDKEYIAVAHGNIEETNGVISYSLGRNPANRTKFAVIEGGRPSETAWVKEAAYQLSESAIKEKLPGSNKNQLRYYVQNGREYMKLRLHPKTGRTHQIRVHLTALRHPLVSDRVYTSRKLLRLDLTWCPRQFLHAAKITFVHPRTEETMTFISTLPEDLQSALKILEDGR